MNTQTGIWKYENRLPSIEKKYRLTLSEGSTTTQVVDGVLFKCEYQNPTGSVKDRGLAYQLSKLFEKDIKKIAISSSGNAAISAVSYGQLANMDITVFISDKIAPLKRKILEEKNATIITTKKPLSECIQYCNKTNTHNLRPSTDPAGFIGFETLAWELYEDYPQIDAVFFPVSSAATLKGVYTGFAKIGAAPKLFAIQSQAVHPISQYFDSHFPESKSSIVDAIVAKYTPLKNETIQFIKKTNGHGFVCTDEEVQSAQIYLDKKDIKTSNEGALALAGLWKAKSAGKSFKNPVCLLTGKKYD